MDINRMMQYATPGIADAYWMRQGKGPNGQPLNQNQYATAQQPMQQPAAGWSPSFLQTPPVPYPRSPYASSYSTTGGRSGGGRGGGGFGGGVTAQTWNAYEPSMFQGPGAYWPGHQAEFQQQQQGAIQGIMAGKVAPDPRQPAQMAASYAAGAYNPNPNVRRMSAQMGYGGGGGAYGSRGYGSSGGIAGDFQSGIDDARQANEARYRDVLEGYNSRMGYLQGAGAQEYEDINRASSDSQGLNPTAEFAAVRAGLGGSGVYNSTVMEKMRQGAEDKRVDNIGRLEERLRGQYLNTQKDTLDFMERRADVPPDLGLLGQIGQLQGQGGGGIQPTAYQVSMGTVPGLGGGTYYGYGGGGGGVPNQGGSQSQKQIDAIRRRAMEQNNYIRRMNASGIGGGAANPFGNVRPFSYGLPLSTDADLAGFRRRLATDAELATAY